MIKGWDPNNFSNLWIASARNPALFIVPLLARIKQQVIFEIPKLAWNTLMKMKVLTGDTKLLWTKTQSTRPKTCAGSLSWKPTTQPAMHLLAPRNQTSLMISTTLYPRQPLPSTTIATIQLLKPISIVSRYPKNSFLKFTSADSFLSFCKGSTIRLTVKSRLQWETVCKA